MNNNQKTMQLARLSQISVRIAAGTVTPTEIDEGRKIAGECGGAYPRQLDDLVTRIGFRKHGAILKPIKPLEEPKAPLINGRFVAIREGRGWQCRDTFYGLAIHTANQLQAKQIAVFARMYARKHHDINFDRFPQSLDEPLLPFESGKADQPDPEI